MAQKSPLAQYAVLGVAGLVAWNWADAQPAGTPWKKAIEDLRRLTSGRPGAGRAAGSGAPIGGGRAAGSGAPIGGGREPAARPVEDPQAAIPPSRRGGPNEEGWVDVALWDLGGVALEFSGEYKSADNGRLRQRTARGGTNEYSAGDMVQDEDGRLLQWLGGDLLAKAATGDGANVLDYYLVGV